MNSNSDVVIVGAGAVGCATAYFLAKSGVKTTIIERESVASQASGFAAGTLVPLSGEGIPGPLEQLAQASFTMHIALWDQLKKESGIDFQARREPTLRVAFDDGDVQELRNLYQYCQQVEKFSGQFTINWLSAEEIVSIEPRLSPEITDALYIAEIGALDSYQYTLALLKAAEGYGAVLHNGTVRGLKKANDLVCGVKLADGELACEKVVIAMGPWTREAEAWTDIPMPISPLKGQILRLETPGPPLQHVISLRGNYLASKPDGLTWAGTTEEQVGFNNEPTQEARQSIMEAARKMMPSIAEAKLVLQTACLRPNTPDGLPIIDRVPGWDGVFVATGAARKGILLSLAMGQATADLVTQGHTQIPISQFDLDRFDKSHIRNHGHT